jgi:hypothetical protein
MITDEMVEAAAEALWDYNEPGCSWAEIRDKMPNTIAVNTRQEARAALEAAWKARKPDAPSPALAPADGGDHD